MPTKRISSMSSSTCANGRASARTSASWANVSGLRSRSARNATGSTGSACQQSGERRVRDVEPAGEVARGVDVLAALLLDGKRHEQPFVQQLPPLVIMQESSVRPEEPLPR